MDKLLTPEQLAELLQVPLEHITALQLRNDGPAFTRIGGAIRYQASDVSDWIDKQRDTPSEGLRKKLSPKQRLRILERDAHRCRRCGRAAPDVELHIAHAFSVRDCETYGASDEFTNGDMNLMTWCKECNLAQGSRSLYPYEAVQLWSRMYDAQNDVTPDVGTASTPDTFALVFDDATRPDRSMSFQDHVREVLADGRALPASRIGGAVRQRNFPHSNNDVQPMLDQMVSNGELCKTVTGKYALSNAVMQLGSVS